MFHVNHIYKIKQSVHYQNLDLHIIINCLYLSLIHGFSYVVEQIKKTPHRGLHLVLGFVKEKDLVSIFEILPKKAIYYFSAPNIKRAEKVSTLIKHAENYKLQARAYKTIDITYK